MFGSTPLILVETPEALAACAEALAKATCIGVDTESDSFHHYREKVCLIQISDLHTDYVVDPLSVPDLSPLAPVFANPAIIKVFHGADFDVVSMKRDHGFAFHGIFDTMISAQFLGLPHVGLADLVHHWWSVTLDKKWQRHDWAARPLLDEHLDYARGDSHWLPALRDLLSRRLAAVGRLEHVAEECAVIERREWVRPRNQPDDFLRVKGSKQLGPDSLRVLRGVYQWRNREAEAQDRPGFKVLPEEILYELAVQIPRSPEALASCFRRNAPFVRRYGAELLDAIEAGLADPEPLPSPARAPARTEAGLRGPRAELLMARLKEWRNREVERRGVPPVAVASNGTLREVVRAAPRTMEAMAQVEDIRRWQLDLYGEAWLVAIAEVLGESEADALASSPPRKRRRRRSGGSEVEEINADVGSEQG